jgi:co-chaperonin GroES (HSP10)
MELRPLNNTVLFQHMDQTTGQSGSFSERTRSGLIIPKLQSTQKGERWGKVVAVGPDVHGVEPGEFILIEPLMWTEHEVFEGEKIWKTNDTKILLVTDDESPTVSW